MSTAQLRRGARLWHIPGVPKSTAKHNFRAWVKSMNQLGPKWILSTAHEGKK